MNQGMATPDARDAGTVVGDAASSNANVVETVMINTTGVVASNRVAKNSSSGQQLNN